MFDNKFSKLLYITKDEFFSSVNIVPLQIPLQAHCTTSYLCPKQLYLPTLKIHSREFCLGILWYKFKCLLCNSENNAIMYKNKSIKLISCFA